MKSREVTELLVVSAVSCLIAFVFVVLLSYGGTSSPPKERFAIVDQYQGCDVVRYTDSSSRYHYLLKCT